MQMRHKYLNARSAAIIAIFVMLIPSLVAQRSRILVVNGKNVGQAVLSSGGRTYVDVEALAQALNASVTLRPDRVTLTLPSENAGDENAAEASVGDAGTPPESQSGTRSETQPETQPETMSRDFASTSLAAVALMRDWRVSIELLISYHLPVTGTYFQDTQERAEQGLQQAGVLATTGQDHAAYQLLQNEYVILKIWADNAIATAQNLDVTRTMGPDVLKNDTQRQKIAECGNGLGAMLVGLRFVDIPACH